MTGENHKLADDLLAEAAILLEKANDLLLAVHRDWSHPDGIWELKQQTDLFVASVKAASLKAKVDRFSDFEAAWSEMERRGYRYGPDALEQVRFGWEIARGMHDGR